MDKSALKQMIWATLLVLVLFIGWLYMEHEGNRIHIKIWQDIRRNTTTEQWYGLQNKGEE